MSRRDRNKQRGASNRIKRKRELARPYLALMMSRTEFDGETSLRLKNEPDQVLDAVIAHAKKARAGVLGIPQPTSVSRLGGNLPTDFSRDTCDEVRWAIATAMQFREEISTFLAAKEEIEQHLVRGNWVAAEARLQHVRERVGHSMWGIATELLIQQRIGGLEANRKLLKSILEEVPPTWTRVLYVFFSHKAEDTISSEEFDEGAKVLDSSTEEGASRVRFRAYLKFRVKPFRFSGNVDLGFFLYMEEAHSVFDRYLMLRWVLPHLLEQEGVLDAKTINRLKQLAGMLRDQEIARALAVADPAILEPAAFDGDLFSLVDRYTRGEYQSVVETGVELVSLKPLQFEYYELIGKALARTGLRGRSILPEGSPGDRILKDVALVAGKGADWFQGIGRLKKLAHQFDNCRLGPLLDEFIVEQAEEERNLPGNIRIHLVASEPTPRMCVAYADDVRGAVLASKMKTRFPDNSALRLFDWALNCIRNRTYCSPPDDLPQTRMSKYRAFVLERLDHYEEALAAYGELDPLGDSIEMVVGDALRGRYRCNLKLNRLSACVTDLARVGVERPHLVSGLAVNELLKMYPYKGKHHELKRNIAWPVLFALAQIERHQPLDVHRLYQVLDDFLTAWKVSRPSELRPMTGQFEKSLLVYLLRNVCVLDVLDSFIWYDSQEDVEAERAVICEWLSDLDHNHRIEYSAEQGELRQRAIMREIAHQSGRSKIYVNVEGILSSLPESAWDRIERSLAYSTLAEELRQGIDIHQKLEEMGLSKEEMSKAQTSAIDEGLRLFRSIFEDVYQRFLHSNEYGLDSNLSQRVRHGVLSGAIRPIFESHHFVTRKNASGEYADNTYWLQKCSPLLPNQHAVVATAFRRLSKDIDDTVELVRNKWLQIKGESNNQQGLFDFEYTVKQGEAVYKQVTAVASADAYVAILFEELWARTEANLQKVREAITNRLFQMFSDVLGRCELAIAPHLSADANAICRTSITSFKTHLTLELKRIADWFFIDDTQRIADFSIAGLIDSLVDNINRFAGDQGLTLTKDFSGIDLMKGSRFRAFWDVFSILFDNILRHSKLDRPLSDLRFAHDNDRVTVRISNPLGPVCDLEAVRTAIEDFHQRAEELANSRLVKGEGRSGFAKLHKIIRFDLRCADYSIVPEVIDDQQFQVNITMQFQGTKDASTGRRG